MMIALATSVLNKILLSLTEMVARCTAVQQYSSTAAAVQNQQQQYSITPAVHVTYGGATIEH
jgi:hypothetical protein